MQISIEYLKEQHKAVAQELEQQQKHHAVLLEKLQATANRIQQLAGQFGLLNQQIKDASTDVSEVTDGPKPEAASQKRGGSKAGKKRAHEKPAEEKATAGGSENAA